MKDKEFFEFLTQAENPPAALKKMAQLETSLTLKGRVVLARFIAFQILGGLISLIICPQFGFSFFVEGHGITHVFRMMGDWACALFCGSLFLSMASIIAIFSMKKEELWWIWRRHKFSLVMLPPVFWSILMLMNVTLRLPQESLPYHLSWLAAAIGMQLFWARFKSNDLLLVK
jgi:hypothetical protein